MTVAPGTNIVRYSGTFDNPIWYNTAAYVAKLGTTDSPTFTAYRLGVTSTEVPFTLHQDRIPEYQPNTVYTASIWFRNEKWPAATPLTFWIRSGTGPYTGIFATFDPTNPSAGAGAPQVYQNPGTVLWTNATSGVEVLANGWARAWISATSPGTSTGVIGIVLQQSAGNLPVGISMLIGGINVFVGTNTIFVNTTTSPADAQYYPTFNFPEHKVATRYQNNSDQIQFGNGWVFTSKPISPIQRQFTLTFEGLRWVFDNSGNIDPYTDAINNAGALDAFYRQVQMGGRFYYPHDIYGNLIVRFFKPLEWPDTLKGSQFNVLTTTTVELLELPQ